MTPSRLINILAATGLFIYVGLFTVALVAFRVKKKLDER